MDGFVFLAVIVSLAVLSALALMPLALPWPQLVRWTVTAQLTDHVGCAATARFDFREVVLVSVDETPTHLRLVIADGRPYGPVYFEGRPAPEVVTMLHEWCSLRTPMLLYTDAEGLGTLSGPSATISNLRHDARAAHTG